MNFRNISAWCIRNPVPPIVLFIGLMLAGLVAFMGMEVNNNPDIDFPAAEINIAQPGAAPTEMENQITQKVEAAVRSVNGVEEINSSVREGNSNTFVQFKIGTPTDQRRQRRTRRDRRRSAATCPTESSSRRSTASTSPATRSCSWPPKRPT